MGAVGLLRSSLKHLVLLAWPFCALGYPLCTSIRAIESKSEADTLNLIAYWVSFSVILLFEHAFNKLLEWLGIWCYLKLVIVLCLVTNDFVGSMYVYNHIFKPCLSLNPRMLIDWFNKTKNSFSNKDRFLTELEKYVNDNGMDALQNLLVAKGVNLGLATKEVKAVTEVEEAKVSANSVDMSHSEVSHNGSPVAESDPSSTKFEGPKVACKDIDNGMDALQNLLVAKGVNLGLATKEVKAVTEVEQAKVSANGADMSHSEVSHNGSPVAESNPSSTKFEGLKVACNDISDVQRTENEQLTRAVNAEPNDVEADIKSIGVEADIKSIGVEADIRSIGVAVLDQKGAISDEPVDATESRASLGASHLSGEEHKSMVQLLREDGVEFRGSQWRCTACNVSGNSIHTLKTHLSGRKHVKKCKNKDGHG